MLNSNGLKDKEVIESRNKYGNNCISGKNENTFFSLFIETLGDPIIKILLIALAIKTIFLFKDFDYFETIGIVVAIVVASIISAVSEYGSSKAFARMQEESSKIKIKVKRDGKAREIPIDDVVVGDIIILTSGDRVAADGIIISGKLSVDESSLNGESKESYKEETKSINNPSESNKVYRGTTISEGYAEAVVTLVGMNTLYGKMAKSLTEKEEESPLKARLNNLAKIISRIGYAMAVLIAISYLFSKIFILNNFNLNIISRITFNTFIGYLLEAMTLAVSVLVMSVPEGLPMMITLVLSTNSKKMLSNNVLVRKMVGIETAGSLNILFTDKTGTLTKGKMEVVKVVQGNLTEYYSKINLTDTYQKILEDALIYNNDSEYDKISNSVIGGNITDKALLSYAGKYKDNNIKIIDKVLFNSRDKYSISVIEKEGKRIKLIKGAPDKIIRYTSNYIDNDGKTKKIDKEVLNKYIERETNQGLRALAIAISDSTYPTDSIRNSTLVGVVFIKDETREEAIDGVKLIKSAGINIVMVTGDSINTALSIAKETKIVDSQSDIVITSAELNKLSDREVMNILPKLKVVARALPEDKERLVTLAKKLNLVTGMTGDGVNDSTALRRADVSFAMGSGTEVAKEASDIVILDDNILSISKAILYGRTIFKNIRKFIIFQLTVNLAASSLALIGPFIGVPSPITVIQMLWINMVMDTLAGLAFSYETPKIEYMKEEPKKRDEMIINRYMFNEIIVSGLYLLIICLLFLKLPNIKSLFTNDSHFMTAFFTLFIFLAVNNLFNARTHRLNIFSHIKENKPFILIIIFIIIVQIFIVYSGITIFGTTSLNMKEITFIFIISLSIIPVDLIRKILTKRLRGSIGV